MASVTEEPNFTFYLILINFMLNNLIQLVAAALDCWVAQL